MSNLTENPAPNATASVHRPRLAIVGKVCGGIVLGLAVLLAASMLLPSLFGYQRYVITGGSMTGTFDRGSIVYDQVVPTSQLHVGDVITYKPPPLAQVRHPITHRIVAMWRDRHGLLFYRTKGDANRTPDPWKFNLPGKSQARVSFYVPYVGYAFAALDDRAVRVLAIGLPALLIALATLMSLWREAGREGRRAEREDVSSGAQGAAA